MTRLPLVDSMRAVAALTIVAYHLAFLLGGFELDVLGRWLMRLNIGVPLFFVISGFLLYRPWAKARLAGEAAPSARTYAVRRALRILPAYWVALTLIALLAGRSEVFGWPDDLVFYGLLQGYDAERFTGGIGQAWTLTVEVAFYAVLPLLALAMRRVGGGVRGEWAMLAGLVAVSIAFKAAVLALLDGDAPAYLVLLAAFPAQLDMFAAGMALAVVSVAAPERGIGFGRAWLVALVAFAALVHWTPDADAPRVLGEHALQTVVAVALLAPAVLGEGGRALGWQPLAWVGLVSYGVYLWHLDVLRELVDAGLPAGAVIVLGTAISIAVGAASWYGIERYALRLGRRRGTPAVAAADRSAP